MPAHAQSDRFQAYCAQIAVNANTDPIRNSRLNDLVQVSAQVQNMQSKMREAIARGLDYQQFKAEAVAKNIEIRDNLHKNLYERYAQVKCKDSLTESSPGLPHTAGQNSRDFYLHQVDDVDRGNSSSSESPTETDR